MNFPHKKNFFNFVAPFSSRVVARAEALLLPRLNGIEPTFFYFFRDTTAGSILSPSTFSNCFQKLLGYCFNASKISRASGVDWAPLAKVAATAISSVSSSVHISSYMACENNQTNRFSDCLELSEKCILCVGGYARLYPEYRRLIEAAGGCLWVYRGNQRKDSKRLPSLLTHADMVLCPIDCVNHETYFTVRQYCMKSGKPCVLLQRSNVPTFRKGIKTLIGLSSQSIK
jgi:hypothetical protein